MSRLTEFYRIDNFIDTFALGHYARVLWAQDKRTGSSLAFKVMRHEHIDRDGDIRWEFRAFANEADLLMKLADSPHVVNLLDCGYVESSSEAPSGGEIVSYGRDALGFGRDVQQFAEKGWRPYIAQEYLPRSQSLFYLMRPDRQGMRLRLPTEEGLALALQFGETLKLAHSMGIVYLDHKLEHIYWDGLHLRIIDWNSSRMVEANGAGAARFRMDIHNLCVGILYSLFTGLSPQKTAIRPQPGSMSEVESRYQEITALDFGVEPTLSPALQALLQRGAQQQIETAIDFVDGVQTVASTHGWDFPSHYTSPVSRDARTQLRAGLSRLRKGEDQIREARDLFREAAILEGISPDMEAELKRLVKAVNELLNSRVIP
jgi:serine/threonine protein kinase